MPSAENKRGFGHHPLWAFADHGQGGTGEPLAVLLRPGNAGSNNTAADHISVLREALRQLLGQRSGTRPGRKVLVRIDGAGATHQVLDWLSAQRLSYSVGYGLPANTEQLLALLPKQVWQVAYDSDGTVRDGAWVAELTGLLDLTGWPKGMRVIARKERPHPGAQLRITDADGLRVTAFATNTSRGQLADLELRHRRRARCEDQDPRGQGHRPDQPAPARHGPEPGIFCAVQQVIAQTGALTGKTRRALDSTVLDDAVATQDTVTQLIAAVRRVRRQVPGAAQVVAQVTSAHDYDDPGKPKIAWNDQAAREQLVDGLVRDALAVLAALRDQGEPPVGPAADAVGLLALIAGQDVELVDADDAGGPPRWRIARKVAHDRVISVVDPDARHAHKTVSRRQDGFKALVEGPAADGGHVQWSQPGARARSGGGAATGASARAPSGPAEAQLTLLTPVLTEPAAPAGT